MKIVVDESVSLAVAQRLRDLGHEVVAVAERPTAGMSDTEVYDLARKEKAVLITRDRAFSRPFRFPASALSAVLHIRPGNLSAADEASMVERFLAGHETSWFRGALVTLYRDHVHIRL